MKKLLFILLTLSLSSFAYVTDDADDPNIQAVCADGTYSTSRGQGTCSHHGGVESYIDE